MLTIDHAYLMGQLRHIRDATSIISESEIWRQNQKNHHSLRQWNILLSSNEKMQQLQSKLHQPNFSHKQHT